MLTKKQLKRLDSTETTSVIDLKAGDHVVARVRRKGRAKPHDILYRVRQVLQPPVDSRGPVRVEVVYPDGAFGERRFASENDQVHALTDRDA